MLVLLFKPVNPFIFKGTAPFTLVLSSRRLSFRFAMKMDAHLSFYWKPLLVFLLTVFALSGLRSPLAAAGRSCADTRQVYAEMGYSTGTAPQTQISGNISPYTTDLVKMSPESLWGYYPD